VIGYLQLRLRTGQAPPVQAEEFIADGDTCDEFEGGGLVGSGIFIAEWSLRYGEGYRFGTQKFRRGI